MKSSLPPLDPHAQRHSDQLKKYILKEIQQNEGKISFEQYMSHALYAPNLGYYVAGAKKFGSEGDFITAPEISDFFSQCLARNFFNILEKNPSFHMLELGAGTGKMAAHSLLELERLKRLPEHYYILELSAELKARQYQTLETICPHLLPCIHWISGLPKSFKGIMIANEVLDAIPVRRFCIDQHLCYEFFVTETKGEFALIKRPVILESLSQYHQAIIKKLLNQSSYIFEINEYLSPWLKSIEQILSEGLILMIDYGFPVQEFYHPDRSMGTLMCHYRHHVHSNFFLFPGLQDITAHVDFSLIAETAEHLNMELMGFTNQANFLLNSGVIELLSERLNTASEQEKIRHNHAMHLLCSPSEMGELFKVIALGKLGNSAYEPLRGFTQYDQRHRL